MDPCREFFGRRVTVWRHGRLAEQATTSRVERADEHGAHLWGEAAAHDDHAVIVDPGGELPGEMPRLRLLRLDHPIDPTPRPVEAFDLRRRACTREIEELRRR